MKKAIFAIITVLLALVIVTCDFFPAMPKKDDGAKPKLVKVDGLPGVELTIDVGNAGRALTGLNAETYTDFYEVSFKGANDKVYRATWRAGQKGRIAVPFGDYAGTAPTTGVPAAILFAGKYSDRTLLGVGKLRDVNGTTGTDIDSETYSVTFEIEPLENEIKASSGTFTITTSSAGTPADVKIKSNGRSITIPLFPVVPAVVTPPSTPGDPDTITATANTATWDLTCPNGDGIIVKEEGVLDSVGVLTDAPIPGFKVVTTAGSTISPSANALAVGTNTFILNFDVPAVEGLSSLFIDIPVCALNVTDTTYPETWHIRGGLKNYDFDEGIDDDSLGGAILIGTTVFAEFEVTGVY